MPTKFATIEGNGKVRRVSLTNTLDAPIRIVWEAITQLEHMVHWWPDWQPGGIIEPKEGGRIKLEDGSWIDGVIKTWSPPHILEFTWNNNSKQDMPWFEPATCSQLRIDLVDLSSAQTRLNLIQFLPEQSTVGGTAGWHHFAGERLSQYLNHGEISEDPGRFQAIKLLYEKDL
ncbi:MAG: SRPBCC domain-containing protein [Pseudomonadota bacterium]